MACHAQDLLDHSPGIDTSSSLICRSCHDERRDAMLVHEHVERARPRIDTGASLARSQRQMLPTARSAISGQQLVSVRQRSRSPAGMAVRTMAATATADTIYDFKVKVWTPIPPRHVLLSLTSHAIAMLSTLCALMAIAQRHAQFKLRRLDVLPYCAS